MTRSRLVFVVPAHGRHRIATVCLRHLLDTCLELDAAGVQATAVVATDDPVLLELAHELGFGFVESDNHPLGRKWNDGLELACRVGAFYVVPFGSDDWIDHRAVTKALAELTEQPPLTIGAFRRSSVVSEDGTRLATIRLAYDGGDGIRLIPARLLEPLNYRPADEDRDRALDTSILRRITARHGRPRFHYVDTEAVQIVDWKSSGGGQLNSYEACTTHAEQELDPWEALLGVFPDEHLAAMRNAYRVGVPA